MQQQASDVTRKGAKYFLTQMHHFWCATLALKRPILNDMLLIHCLKFNSDEIILRVTQIRDVFMKMPFFANFTVLSMEFLIKNCLPFFFLTCRNFYQMILSHTLSRGPTITDKQERYTTKWQKTYLIWVAWEFLIKKLKRKKMGDVYTLLCLR